MRWTDLPKPILALAPMAGLSDQPFRQLCRQAGADVVYSEMVSATALFYGLRNGGINSETLSLLRWKKEEWPIIIQLFGSDPEHFAAAAAFIDKNIGPAGIDINCGCPVPKVARQGAGAELMKDAGRVREIIQAVYENSALPISAKIRAGAGKVTALDFLDKINDMPLAGLMIHGRTLAQKFSGLVDTKLIREARRHSGAIILANGGVCDAESARRLLRETEADGLGIARGALGHPEIFQEIKSGQSVHRSKGDILQTMSWHLGLVKDNGDPRLLLPLRQHFSWYCRDFAGAKEMRVALLQARTFSEMKEIMAKHQE